MKTSRIITTLFGASLLFAVGASAQEWGTINLTEKVTVQGTELKPGKYDVKWDGSGPTVQVSIHKGNNTLVTIPAALVSKDSSNARGGYELRKSPDGTLSLVAIYPAGKKFELELGQKQASVTP